MIYLLPHTILNSATRFPEREAFRCGQKSLTFAEMKEKMNQVAGLLHQLNIQKGDRVGIYVNRSIETAIAMYGIMQAGAVYVPLDPKAPIQRTSMLIEDCGISILITNSSQRRNIQKIIAETQTLKTIIGIKGDYSIRNISWDETYERSSDFTCPFPMMEDDLAYIMYTSGSTGIPKGIMHSHASGLNYARLSADLYHLNENDRIGNHAPIHFDISTLGYFTAPFVGACTVIIQDAHTVLPTSLSQLIEKEQLTVWYSVPLAITQMLQKGLLEERNLTALKWILYGGEPFPPKYLRTLMNMLPHTQFCNVYGPAEVNQCTFYHIPKPPENDNPIPLGETWNNTEALVVDQEGKEIKLGESGELLIRTVTMMKGYWQQPELTEKSLYKQKSNTGRDEIFYKTGDLVKIDLKGQLHFLGRIDHQVKIRGYRVELDAVEAILVSHQAVLEAAVFSMKGEGDSLKIEAAVILETMNGATVSELMMHLKDELPFYAVPESIRIFETFPRTGSGKVKRSALKANWGLEENTNRES